MPKGDLPLTRDPLANLFRRPQTVGVEDLPGAKLIAVGLLDPNPYQPRTTFDQVALEELAASIRARGVLQPLTVRQAGDRYQIGAGERRWRAAQIAGLTDVPCVARPLSDEEMEVFALVENVQRADLEPLDEAHAYRKLMDRFGFSLREVAGRVAKSHEHVARRLRLIADPAVEQAVRAGTVGPSAAAELARIEDPARRRDLLRRAEAGDRLTMKDVAPPTAVTIVTEVTGANTSPTPPPEDHRDRAKPVTIVTAAPSLTDAAPTPPQASNDTEKSVTIVTTVAVPMDDATPAPPAPRRPRHIRDGWIAGADLRIVVLLESTEGQAPRDQV
ncbi:MAG: ParB/RepB/Spo0J family partition protein, partial [Chloroflexota bacterium]|nr:ParB/RepB/Spo0J family partition protein [Chloroflexota bacterium]